MCKECVAIVCSCGDNVPLVSLITPMKGENAIKMDVTIENDREREKIIEEKVQ